MEKRDCPGHSGKCKFCGEEEGRFRYIGEFVQVDRKTSEPVVDCCCKACSNNKKYVDKKFGVYESAKLGHKVPKGDEV